MNEDDIKKLFGQNLKYLRNKKNFSQLQLADKADVTFNFINDIENGKKWISPSTLSKLCNALETAPYQFFVGVQTSFSDNCNEDKLQEFSTDILNQINEIMRNCIERYKK